MKSKTLVGFGALAIVAALAYGGMESGQKARNPRANGFAKRTAGGVLRFTLRTVTDPGMGNAPAYTYLMPKGWRNEDSIRCVGGQQPYSLAVLATKSPDGGYALGVFPALYGMGYSNPTGGGGTWIRDAEDAVGKIIASSPMISDFRVLDRMVQPLPSNYGAVAGARPSANLAVLRCTYAEKGVAKEALIVSRFDNAIIEDPYARSQTWTVSFQVMAAPRGERTKSRTFLRQASTFFYSACITPEYFRTINKVTMTSAQINREAALRQGETIMRSYWDRQRANDASAQNFSDMMRGVGRYTDPNGGAPMVLPQGPQYWVARDGSVVASDDPNYDPNSEGGGTYRRMKSAG